MPSPWQVECLFVRMRSLENEILRVKHKDHPYPEPDIVFDALLLVIKDRSDYLKIKLKIARYNKTPLEQVVFNTIAKTLEEIAVVFSFATRVDSARIPFELMRSLSWAARSLLKENCPTVVRLDPGYNYSISSSRRIFEKKGWDKQWKMTTLREGEEGTPPTVLLLGFPSPDAGSILVHALAAHEFGHEFAYKWEQELAKIRQQVMAEIKSNYNTVLQEYIYSQIVKREGESTDDAYEAGRRRVVDLLDRIAKNWLKEIFSDLVAARLVGPAFLAAFDRILLGLDAVSPKYPPGSLRRRLVHKYLEQTLPEVVRDEVWAPLFSANGESTASSERLFAIFEEVFEGINGKISGLLGTIPSPLALYKGDELAQTGELMEEYIENLAPPSVPLEVSGDGHDADKFWILMYAAWHYRLSPKFLEFQKDYGWEKEPGKAEMVLGNLVLHGLQSMELKFRWVEKQQNREAGGAYVN